MYLQVGKKNKKDWNKIVRKSCKTKDQIGSSKTSLRRLSLAEAQRQATAWDKVITISFLFIVI